MMDKINVTEIFGCDVFNDSVMRSRLPKDVQAGAALHE